MTTNDDEVLDLAWEMLIAGKSEILKSRIGDDDDKKFASYSMQCDNLKLKPWQEPPCHLSGDDPVADCDASAHKILRRMQAAGVSIWHPDPLAALAEAAKKMNA